MKFVLYTRVSTGKQDHGLDAQRTAGERFASSRDGEVVAVFSERESGKNDHRPQLVAAIDECARTGSTLLIAKLDRLSRNVAFLFNLKAELDSKGVNVIAADMPEVLSNSLMLSVMAGMAQHEREIISKRTKEGLQVAKAKGKKIGRPKGIDNSAALEKARAVRTARLRQGNSKAIALASSLKTEGLPLQSIANALNASGIMTSANKTWDKSKVCRLLKQVQQ